MTYMQCQSDDTMSNIVTSSHYIDTRDRLAEAQEIGKLTVEAAEKLGEQLLKIPKASGGDRSKSLGTQIFARTKTSKRQ